MTICHERTISTRSAILFRNRRRQSLILAVSPSSRSRAVGMFFASLALFVLFSFPCTAQTDPLANTNSAVHQSNDPWWKHAVFYEIYPRSFQDSDGDGVGDLNGITQRLDYLESLGVDAIWIAPFYPSPQVDFGYDISDYQSIDAQFGTLADFDRLVSEAHRHHIRLILDMVLNHTSDQHPWFIDAAS